MATTLIDTLAQFPVAWLDHGDRVYSYRSPGDGETVLMLLHGIGSGAGSWVQQLAVLGERFRVIAWDAPGFGETTALTGPQPEPAAYAAALANFLDGLNLEHVHLLGHSLGALMATAFARHYPERLQSLTLAAPAIGYGNAAPEVRQNKLSERLQHMQQLGPDELANTRAGALLSAQASAEALELVRWNMRRLQPAGYAQAAHMLANSDLLDIAIAGGYHGPVLVMCGDADRITPDSGARRVAAAFAGSRYQTLPGAGHACYIEAPKPFNRFLADFIGNLS
jgi:pimeloyl-ACP methyl ester carboxylesterase